MSYIIGYDPFADQDEYVGADAGGFMPYLGMVGKLAGGLLGGGSDSGGDQMTKMMAMQMMQAEKDKRDAAAKAERDRQSRNQMLLIAGAGILGLGALIYLLKR
jgi:hypothetical protein